MALTTESVPGLDDDPFPSQTKEQPKLEAVPEPEPRFTKNELRYLSYLALCEQPAIITPTFRDTPAIAKVALSNQKFFKLMEEPL